MILKKLVNIAISEGEGLGTAYEYYCKLKLLNKNYSRKKLKTLLIYGLPEKYGYSMDFILFGMSKKYKITIIDERPSKINELKKILVKNKIDYKINFLNKRLDDTINSKYDLILSSEVLQRLNNKKRFIENLYKSKNYMIFVPNSDNTSHRIYSKLKGFNILELDKLFPKSIKGYIDSPLFEAGKTIDYRKREVFKKIYFLLYFVYLIEVIMLKFIKIKKAHICYVLKKIQ